MEYYSAIKKNEILPCATMWMELEGIMLSEIRERQKLYDFIHMRTLRDKTDERKGNKNNIKTGGQNKRLINTENKLRVTGGVVEGAWAKWVRGT